MMILWLFFLCVPLAEIAVFLGVGDEIGILNTLLLCVLTAIVGAALIKWQGLMTLASAQASLRQGIMPADEIFTGFCLLAAGALLMTPGFVTDTIGFALLVPAVRIRLKGWLGGHFSLSAAGMNQPRPSRPDIIDGDYEVVAPDNDRKPPKSLH